MSTKRTAAIDLGSNTVLMLIADVNPDSSFHVVRDEHRIARLGEGVNKTGMINEDAYNRAKNILLEYREICKESGVDEIKIAATSAMREASNGKTIRSMLSEAIGAEIKIIEGEDEAAMSFTGTVETDEPSIVIDIGGGSTEIIHGAGTVIDYRKSVKFGAVKIKEAFFPNLPPKKEEISNANEFIQIKLIEFGKMQTGTAYSVAGTPTTLAAIALGLNEYDDSLVHGYQLKLQELESLTDMLLGMSAERIINEHGVHPGRADVLAAGSMILLGVYRYLQINSTIVSSKGLRYGLLKMAI